MRRFFGRRDVKLAFILWVPIVWTLVLSAGDRDLQYGDELLQAPSRFLLGILGPGVIMLGAASGVERYRSLRRTGPPPVGDEARALSLSFVLGYGSLVGGLMVFWTLAEATIPGFYEFGGHYKFDLILSHPPFGLFPTPHYGDGPRMRWELSWLSYSVTLPWVGWAVAYRWGRSRGQLVPPILAMIPSMWVLGWVLKRIVRALVSGEGPFLQGEFTLFSAFFFANLAVLAAGFIALGGLIHLWLERRGKLKWRWCYPGVVTVLMMPILVRQGGSLLRTLRPWPPRAQLLAGLDPQTRLLWAWCGSGIYNLRLFGIQPVTDPEQETAESPQSLVEVKEVQPLTRTTYLPSVPAMLLNSWKRPEGGMVIELRTADAIQSIRLDSGEWCPYPLPLLSPDPEWIAWLDRTYHVSIVRREEGGAGRQIRNRVFLYCPKTGERKFAVAHPTVSATNTQFWQRPDSPYGLFYSWSGGKFGPVPIEIGNGKGGCDVNPLCADGFLSSASPRATNSPPRATLIWGEGLRLMFEMFEPWGSDELQKGPSPVGNRGYIWEKRKGRLRIFEEGKLVEAEIADPISVPPSWSPDGKYLVYCSRPSTPGPVLLKLAFPERKELLRAGGFPAPAETNWSARSDWVAVSAEFGDSLVVVTVPGFHKRELSTHVGGDLGLNQQPVKSLHDGSLAYVEEGKVFQWRPEWEKPVCIYDPARETVLKWENAEVRSMKSEAVKQER